METRGSRHGSKGAAEKGREGKRVGGREGGKEVKAIDDRGQGCCKRGRHEKEEG